jgi:phage shock protein A|tara:strand:- start:243 stop:512 length:270 start_codon:yes stop_codon:yes gene_type:complete
MNTTTQTEYLAKMNTFSKNVKLAEEKIKQKEQEIEALKEKIDKIRKQQSHYDWEVKSSGVMKDFDLIVATANGREARPELNHLKEAMNQ